MSEISKMALSSTLFMMHLPNLVFAGYYLVKNNQLEIGPYQGNIIACSPIQKGRGVCGNSYELEKEIIIKDVKKIQNYISCDSITKSEIIIPIFQKNQLVALLDLDGKNLEQFDQVDSTYLNLILNKIFT